MKGTNSLTLSFSFPIMTGMHRLYRRQSYRCSPSSLTLFFSFPIMTGMQTDAAQVPAALKAWEKLGVTVFALGIGKNIKDAGKSRLN